MSVWFIAEPRSVTGEILPFLYTCCSSWSSPPYFVRWTTYHMLLVFKRAITSVTCLPYCFPDGQMRSYRTNPFSLPAALPSGILWLPVPAKQIDLEPSCTAVIWGLPLVLSRLSVSLSIAWVGLTSHFKQKDGYIRPPLSQILTSEGTRTCHPQICLLGIWIILS